MSAVAQRLARPISEEPSRSDGSSAPTSSTGQSAEPTCPVERPLYGFSQYDSFTRNVLFG